MVFVRRILVICIYLFGGDVHLVVSQIITCVLVRLWQILARFAPNHEDCVTVLLHAFQEGREIEIRDDLRARWNHVGRVQVIPHTMYFPDGEPMVDRMADESLLVIEISNGCL